ncbi:EscG/YscG/SsaH family type III secretion system needle protein co-chaperone [Salmonella enterica subsp. enterica serovar Essen]|uniref:EscG/YscG/SsaH family type III secretion system needle protein co-chaperone n=1 Tax=Salmonella TaxID=590 RepID=UPI00071CA48E|nr:EscG/YscG/SsaH family type III secretion system needle protein co-chaperone [Salmonella enterica]EBF2916091.1 EscG/YscG/SsaH family type III secretion system needle protein co-chaperone [Salmonella enterica subsp. enterica serovar Agama]EBH8753196.1 EscG/YscG/SsaH family type III secretion system needle protein co-chaperone [Salmonella enterica subsp. houtenae serovar 44:z4,z23:-]EBW2264625.1 EscG/YscG/SsaH family type III secretion system needle protein co-chaperone [Salmonella enterica subs
MESLLKSEVISDDVRRLLLEIMFAGVNHSLISQVHTMLPALTVIVPDRKLQLVCLALLLAGLNEPLKAAKILSDIDLPEAMALRLLFPAPKEGFEN